MTGPLDGYAILVTRPSAQAKGLIDAIEHCGGHAIFAPMLEIRALDDDPQMNELIASISTCDIVIFISRNAVEHGVRLIRAQSQSLHHAALFAVGVGTAAALQAQNIHDVTTPRAEFSSEGLLKLHGLSPGKVAGRRILIFRGRGGRTTLTETLTARGADVAHCEVYERIVPPTDLKQVLADSGTNLPDAAVITSLEALTNLADKIDEQGLDILYDMTLLVAGSRIAREVPGLGFTVSPLTVENPSDESIRNALIRWAEDET